VTEPLDAALLDAIRDVLNRVDPDPPPGYVFTQASEHLAATHVGRPAQPPDAGLPATTPVPCADDASATHGTGHHPPAAPASARPATPPAPGRLAAPASLPTYAVPLGEDGAERSGAVATCGPGRETPGTAVAAPTVRILPARTVRPRRWLRRLLRPVLLVGAVAVAGLLAAVLGLDVLALALLLQIT
jgi:hypothetical protein